MIAEQPTRAVTKHTSPPWRWLVKLAVTGLLLVAIASLVGWPDLWRTLLGVELGFVLLGWTLGMAGRLGQGLQMALIMRRVGMPIRTPRVVAANSLSVFYGLVLPGELLAGAAKWADLSTYTGKKFLVFHAMVYNRLMFLMSRLVLGITAVCLHNPWNAPHLPLAGGCLLAVLSFGCFAVYSRRLGAATDFMLLKLVNRLFPRTLAQKLRHAVRTFNAVRAFPMRFHLFIFAVACLNMCVSVAVFLTMAAAVGMRLPVLLGTWTRAVSAWLSQLPITLQGIGVREVTLVGILGQFGFPDDAAFSLGVLLLSNILLFALVGFVWQLVLLFHGQAQPREQPRMLLHSARIRAQRRSAARAD